MVIIDNNINEPIRNTFPPEIQKKLDKNKPGLTKRAKLTTLPSINTIQHFNSTNLPPL